jgi:photosystem II stability/assembly factor-like uncharacterized protein
VSSARIVLALGVLAAGAFGARPASANGRFPAANQVVVAPSDAKTLLLRATFGFLLSRDGGGTWDWICEDAVGYAGQQDPAVGVTAGGSLLSGSFEGLSVSLDGGCNWSFAAGGLQNVVDLAVRPDTPHQAVAVTNAFAGSGDAGNVYRTQVWSTADDGAHWAALGAPIDPSLILVTIEVARSDPQRIYLSGHRGAKFSGSGVLLVSTNGGASYTEQAVALDAANESDPFVAAVDPSNADVVYLRTGGGSTSRLLVTTDAGKTFAAKYSGGAMLGFALSPDGSKVYLGGADDGLQVASSADCVFHQTSTVPVQCLRTNGSTLYVCSDEMTAGFTLGASADDGVTITPALHVANVRGPLACAPSSSTGACVAEWPALKQVIGGIEPPPPPADAGSVLDAGLAKDAGDAGDAGAGASMPAPASASGCHCHAAGASRTEHGEDDGRGCAVMLAVAALSLARSLSTLCRGTPSSCRRGTSSPRRSSK